MNEQEWLNIFGDNLAEIIKESRMTQAEFAEWIDVSQSTISSYLNKQRMPSIRTIINMSYALGIDIHELIDFGERIR